MSLTAKRKTTEKKLAANRVNGRKSRGAVTPTGKVRATRANLRHGFYVQTNGALTALGEDPAQYAGLMHSLQTNLVEGLEIELKELIGDTLWRMKRGARMQNGLAAKRVLSGLDMEQLVVAPGMLEIHETYEALCTIGKMLHRPDSTPARGEITAMMDAFGDTPPDDVSKLFPLLQSYGEAAAKAPGPVKENGESEPAPSTAAGQEREAALETLKAALFATMLPYRRTLEVLTEKCEKVRSPENIAALMAPRDDSSLLMQRYEDSNLRQLWRLTNILAKVQNGALT
jgi:hypothetical protein